MFQLLVFDRDDVIVDTENLILLFALKYQNRLISFESVNLILK